VPCVKQLKRYKTYVRLLRVKTAAALRENDARHVTTVIGELEAGEHLAGNPAMTSSPPTEWRHGEPIRAADWWLASTEGQFTPTTPKRLNSTVQLIRAASSINVNWLLNEMAEAAVLFLFFLFRLICATWRIFYKSWTLSLTNSNLWYTGVLDDYYSYHYSKADVRQDRLRVNLLPLTSTKICFVWHHRNHHIWAKIICLAKRRNFITMTIWNTKVH